MSALRDACACIVERAEDRSLQPADRHVAHTVRPRDIGLRLACGKTPERFL